MTVDHHFPLISGTISLDLVNTEVVRNGTRFDLLRTTEDVVAWVHTMQNQHILVDQQFVSDVSNWAEDALPYLRETRLFLRQGYEQIADGDELSTDWVHHLETFMERAPFAYRIKNNALTAVPVGKPVDALLALIAFDSLNLYVTEQLRDMHRCANPECVLLFMDGRGRRKWCSMKICGNREKVSRHQLSKKKGK